MRASYALLLLVTSCSATLDLDRFHKKEAAQASTSVDTTTITYFDFEFSARSMQSHINETMEWRLVDKGNTVQAKGVYTAITRPDFKISYPKFIPKSNGPYRIDWWADHNNSKRYDGIQGGINDKDHAWRRVLADPLPEDVHFTDGVYVLDFLHDTNFVDIFTDLEGNPISGDDVLLPLKLNIKGTEPFQGKMLEIHVSDKASGRLVALHRIGFVRQDYIAEVTGVLDEQTTYEVAAFVDLDAKDEYVSTDPSWKVDMTSTETGIEADLDLSATPQTSLEPTSPSPVAGAPK
jgi:hypothetical protein